VIVLGLLLALATPAIALAQESDEEQAREAEMFGAEEPQAKPEAASDEDQDSSEGDSGEDEEEREDADSDPEAAREAEMFGGSQDGVTSDDGASAVESREDALFGGAGEDGKGEEGETQTFTSSRERILDRIEDAEDELAIGGLLFMQLNYNIPEGYNFEDQRFSAPNLVDLYLDARPNPRVRAYLRGRLTYDYTRPRQSSGSGTPSLFPTEEAAEETSTDTQLPLGFSTGTLGASGGQNLQVQLDQLWLKFDVARTVYVTLGRQRIRWGAGRFWNPTDFLNATQINPIAIFDQRLGVDLLKLHIPIEKLGWNLYAVGSLGEADTLDDVGGALRAEILFSNAELSLSFATRRQTIQGPQPIPSPVGDDNLYEPTLEWPQTGTPMRLGADLSAGLGPFDVRLEGALVRGLLQPFYRGELNLDLADLSFPEDHSRADEWVPQLVASADIILNYGSGDSLILGAEYFYNGQGYGAEQLEDPNFLLWLALQGGLRPLYLGRHYGALAIVLPSPGSLDDSSFTFSTIGNLSDGSFLSRLDYSYRLLQDLNINAFAMYQFGAPGELNYSNTIEIPGQDPLVIPGPELTLGAAFRMNF
jgi:hypothetical protein